MRSIGSAPREDFTNGKAGTDRSGGFSTMLSLLPYLWPVGEWNLRARVVIAMVFLVLSKVAIVMVPIFYKDAVDALVSAEEGLLLIVPVGVILAYGLARIASLGFSEARDAIFARVGQRAIRQIILEVFRHLHRLSLRFHLERQTGGLSRIIERGNRAIELLLRISLFNLIPTIIELILVFGILWYMLDIEIAAITLVTVVVYIVYTMVVTQWRIQFRRNMNDADTSANTRAIDSLLNYETVKYFGNEDHEARRYDEGLARYEEAAVKSSVSLAALNFGQAAIISVGLTLVMLLSASGIVDGSMTVGDFVLANTYLMQLYQPLNLFGFVYREIRQALIDIEQMFQLLAVDAEIIDTPGAPAIAVDGASIRFENVNFAYDERRPILRDVDFMVPAGKEVAVVGPSGAGKSTISRLLYRFYDVGEGAILIDDQDLRNVTQHSLRASIGIVPQDTVLFNDTVFYNIAYGRPGATREEVEEAARLARIHDFVVGLPDGYETMVGERGLKLSGGEKQRVAIARTILKDPKVLIFDEATSALDTHTERAIQSNLNDIARGRTTLIVAHRLSTVVDADEILVLEEGQIVERGRHADLLGRNGVYAGMWRHQQESGEEITEKAPIL
ncbi:MAG: ABC transporter ATP-binding protein/permease [Rhodospirillaceae bacterium]|jgi:ATP-binding cassette, subfamily B, heavy metal transporter|nr:ABC transporter ATP-binding protein/permease [Rhodospirillaceae bacterium]